MTSYRRGDRFSPIVVDMPVDLDPAEFTTATMIVDTYLVTSSYNPDTYTATGVVSGPDPDIVFADGPTGSGRVGVVGVRVAWTRPDGTTHTTDADPIVVEAVTSGFPTLAAARREWPNALSDATLYELLRTASDAVYAFAPDAEGNTTVQAIIAQARNLANAAAASPATGDLGNGTYAITPRPLDWHVRQMLRPKTGTFVVG